MKECRRMNPYHLVPTATPPRVGSVTPWGIADHATSIGPGMVLVTTPSHGGLWLSSDANTMVPSQYRRADQWYEEDCEIVIALAFTQRLVTSDLYAHFCANTLSDALTSLYPSIAEYLRINPS
jgi:hypothetical protein